MMKSDPPKSGEFEVLEQGFAFKGFSSVLRFLVKHTRYDGKWTGPLEREVFRRSDAATVILYDPARESVVTLEQFRTAPIAVGENPWVTEFTAGGMIKEGEEPRQVALRECQEEVGLRDVDPVAIYSYFDGAGASADRTHLFYALIDSSEIDGVYGLAAEHEDIRVYSVTFETACDMVEKGIVRSATSIIALQWLKLNRANLT